VIFIFGTAAWRQGAARVVAAKDLKSARRFINALGSGL
jgi:hypothetical protein